MLEAYSDGTEPSELETSIAEMVIGPRLLGLVRVGSKY